MNARDTGDILDVIGAMTVRQIMDYSRNALDRVNIGGGMYDEIRYIRSIMSVSLAFDDAHKLIHGLLTIASGGGTYSEYKKSEIMTRAALWLSSTDRHIHARGSSQEDVA